MKHHGPTGVLLLVALVPFHAAGQDSGGADKRAAREILELSGVQGGLVVHVGCSDGRLTCALRADEAYVVQGLDTDQARIAAARQRVATSGLTGKITIDRWDGQRLPYIDNLVNLLVLDAGAEVADAEVDRVLVPGGAACVRKGSAWSVARKRWPETIDQWTHYLHDATNNAVAQDQVVGPPRHYQWIGAPRWLRHHDHMSGLSAMVSAGGRLFYIIDLGPRWSVLMPPRWTLVARDAFNGKVLWQRPIARWHAHLWPLKKGPADLMRRLVAHDDEVYVTMGIGQPVVALDGATGAERRTYEGTAGAEELILADGVLYALVNPGGDAYRELPRDSVPALRAAGRDWNWDQRPRRIVALSAGTGRTIWTHEARVAPVTLATDGRHVCFHNGQSVVSLEAATGRVRWTSQPIPRWRPLHVLFGPALVLHEDVVLFAGGEKMHPTRGGRDTMTALGADSGQVLWTAPHPPSGYASAEDLLVIGGLVWCGETTNRRDTGTFVGRDLHSGEVRRQFPGDDWPHMPHHRCYRAKATCNYILTSRTGIEFVDLAAEHWLAHHWVRGACNYGILPCNGLVYAPPHSCACYPVAKLSGLNALAPQRGAGAAAVADSEATRWEAGPAFSARDDARRGSVAATDWPTFRHDSARSGATDVRVPTAALRRLWKTELGGRLSSPVSAHGQVYVAAIEQHTVHALDAASGRPQWHFVAGGRVDSPPTLWQGNVLFGSADGFVYCLRASDGALVWRFRAAPGAQRMMASEQVESVWPVHGSVLVHEGTVYCVAGRAMWLDGGLRLLRLDARTGRKRSETLLDDRYPGSSDNLQRDVKWPNLPVALPDILSCDGRFVYMRSQPFDLAGQRIDVTTPRDYRQQRGPTAHLFSPTGFLDDSWWHRSYWLYGRSFIGGAGGWYLAGYQAPTGRLLTVAGDSIYGFGRAPQRMTGTPNTYHLFACSRPVEVVDPNPRAKARRRGASVYGEVRATRIRYRWSQGMPLLVRGLLATADSVVVAGPPGMTDEGELYHRYTAKAMQQAMADTGEAFAGRRGACVMFVSKADGQCQAAYRLASAPVFDGLAATPGRLFVSTMDGHVLCLGAGAGTELERAPEMEPGPVPPPHTGFVATEAHPDFQHLAAVRVQQSDIGYRLSTAPQAVGWALQKLATPRTGRAEFTVRVRPRPDAPTPDTPGNGFLVFGDATRDEQLIKCGFRIAGQRLFINQGPFAGGRSVSAPISIKAKEVVELRVVVDLQQQAVSVEMKGRTLRAPLERRLDAVRWVGYAVSSVPADFSAVRVLGE